MKKCLKSSVELSCSKANTPKTKVKEKNNSSDRDSEITSPAEKEEKDEDFSLERGSQWG